MRWYLDASALLKFYKEEAGTDNIYRLFQSYSPLGDVATSQYTAVEAASAVQRLYNAGEMDRLLKDKLLAGFSEPEGIELLPVGRECLRSAIDLVGRHNLRGGDAIQLSSALEYKSASSEKTSFVCSDASLNGAARKEGLEVYDPSQSLLEEWLKSAE